MNSNNERTLQDLYAEMNEVVYKMVSEWCDVHKDTDPEAVESIKNHPFILSDEKRKEDLRDLLERLE
jgi:hypothetical protein